MRLLNQNAEIYIPDNTDIEPALARTTALCIAAHQDDIEIMAYGTIADCYDQKDRFFTGVTVTDGAGSPRSGRYVSFTDEEMKKIRVAEQKQASQLGKYAAMVLLSHSSAEVKQKENPLLINELAELINTCAPEVVYTHNPADKHDTHVATAMKVLAAIRSLPEHARPQKLYGMEVWRGLDWLCDEDKFVQDTSLHPDLAAGLLKVFDSQIAGGKDYEKAALGRRYANATFFAHHTVDDAGSLSFGLDLTPLIKNDRLSPAEFVNGYLDRLKAEVTGRINQF